MILHYRIATSSEIPQLKKLGLISYGQYFPLMSAEAAEKMRSNIESDEVWKKLFNNSVCFVCESEKDTEKKIIGMAFLIYSGEATDIYKAEWAQIRFVGIDPEYSGRGIATQLTRLCIEEAKKQGEKTIALHTSEIMKAAQHIYRKEGFAVLQEIPERFGLKYWLFTKTL